MILEFIKKSTCFQHLLKGSMHAIKKPHTNRHLYLVPCSSVATTDTFPNCLFVTRDLIATALHKRKIFLMKMNAFALGS